MNGRKDTYHFHPHSAQIKNNTLGILHNPYLLSRKLWRAHRIISSDSQSDTIVLVCTSGSGVTTKITFTNHDDGVSVFEQSKTGVSILIRWLVTREEYVGIKTEERDLVEGFRQPRYQLGEMFTVRRSTIIWWLFTTFQNNHFTTRCLMEYSEAVAAEENRKAKPNNDLLLAYGRSYRNRSRWG